MSCEIRLTLIALVNSSMEYTSEVIQSTDATVHATLTGNWNKWGGDEDSRKI